MFSFILSIAYKTIYFLRAFGAASRRVFSSISFLLWFECRMVCCTSCSTIRSHVFFLSVCDNVCVRAFSSNHRSKQQGWKSFKSNGMLHFNMFFMTTIRMSSVIVISIALHFFPFSLSISLVRCIRSISPG